MKNTMGAGGAKGTSVIGTASVNWIFEALEGRGQ